MSNGGTEGQQHAAPQQSRSRGRQGVPKAGAGGCAPLGLGVFDNLVQANVWAAQLVRGDLPRVTEQSSSSSSSSSEAGVPLTSPGIGGGCSRFPGVLALEARLQALCCRLTDSLPLDHPAKIGPPANAERWVEQEQEREECRYRCQGSVGEGGGEGVEALPKEERGGTDLSREGAAVEKPRSVAEFQALFESETAKRKRDAHLEELIRQESAIHARINGGVRTHP
jgi:hypothetical protein